MNEYHEQRLRVMRDLVQHYDRGTSDLVSLASLIADLERLLESLQSVDETWRRAFRRQWGVLEIEYAVTLDRGHTSLNSDGLERISRAVEEMQSLLATQLQAMSDLYESVRRAVHTDWDPLGVAELIDEMGEYDSYVPGLCELLITQASEKELFEYLWRVETESIGLEGDREATERFAKWLCELRSSTGS